jgi:ferredoxin
VALPGGKQVREVMLPRDFQEVEHVVSLAKLKGHMQATYTGAIKNFYGAIPFRQRKQIHGLAKYVRFSEGIVDIFQAVRPRFGIIDGIWGMEGRGPSAGKPRHLGLLLASADLVALDRVAVSAVGWDRLRVHHIQDAGERGLGEADLNRIRVVGEKLDAVRIRFSPPPTAFRNPPRFLLNAVYNLWSIKPAVILANCTGCGTCVAACPASAIALDPLSKAVIDYSKCIECFCCHELCPSGAVTEKPSALKSLLSRIRKRS